MSKLFGGDKPTESKTPVAPIPDDQLDQANQERTAQRKYGSRGRSGTVLTGESRLG